LKKKKARPAPRAQARAKKPARGKVARHVPKKSPKPAAKAKPLGKTPAAAKTDDKAKKPTIKSAKAALEQLEAKLAEGLKSKAGRGRPGRKAKKEEWLAAMAVLPKEDAETRRTRLKTLIKLGKDRGFLTYAEINDHLPDDLVDAEQIEAIISTFGDMGIQVYDQAPDQEQLLITAESAQVASNDEDVEEQAEAALSTVDSEFGRTTDPVRMYMREMGSVELLTREGEIEIAKRIEEGLRHMIQAISACPTTVREILDLAEKVEKEEMRIDEVVDGLIDPNAKDDFDPRKAAALISLVDRLGMDNISLGTTISYVMDYNERHPGAPILNGARFGDFDKARELVEGARTRAAGIYVIPPFKQPTAALDLLA